MVVLVWDVVCKHADEEDVLVFHSFPSMHASRSEVCWYFGAGLVIFHCSASLQGSEVTVKYSGQVRA